MVSESNLKTYLLVPVECSGVHVVVPSMLYSFVLVARI
jgi:hypothetical protein